jgi:predicted RNase H-like HicB family nuclease
MQDFRINVSYSEKDKCYVADIPDLAYCSAFGDTPEQAVRAVVAAKTAWLKAAKKEGKAIPEPKYQPTLKRRRR